jgi:hypothetical protein
VDLRHGVDHATGDLKALHEVIELLVALDGADPDDLPLRIFPFGIPTPASVSAHELERRVVERIRAIGNDPALIAEVARQAMGQMDERRIVLKAEQRQLGKDLKRERASLRRLAGRNGDSSARLAAVQQRIDTVEGRLSAIAQDLDATMRQAIDERQVAAALSEFNLVWDSLLPSEKARTLNLLTERIAYDGRIQDLEVTLRPSGIGSLHEVRSS